MDKDSGIYRMGTLFYIFGISIGGAVALIIIFLRLLTMLNNPAFALLAASPMFIIYAFAILWYLDELEHYADRVRTRYSQ